MRQFDTVWATLEQWSPRLYLFAGVLLVGYAVLNGITAFTDVAYVTVEDVVGPAGLLVGFVGLLGLYPALANGRPILARAGAVCVSLGAVGLFGITMIGFAVLAGVASATVPAVMLFPVAVGMIPGYLSFSLASLRVGERFRPVGLLLLAPAVVFAAMLSQPFVYSTLGMFSESTMAWSNFAISGGQAVAHLAIGYVLRTRSSLAGREVSSTGVVAG